MSDKAEVRTHNAPPPAAAYSQGVRKGSILQISGQVAADPTTNELVHIGDVAAQTTQVLINLKAIVDASGATFDDIVMLRVYLTDRTHFPIMNSAFESFVRANTNSGVLPARTTVINGLPNEHALVEIDALAVVGNNGG
jgi:reactive intermediate/imine deaminase